MYKDQTCVGRVALYMRAHMSTLGTQHGDTFPVPRSFHSESRLLARGGGVHQSVRPDRVTRLTVQTARGRPRRMGDNMTTR